MLYSNPVLLFGCAASSNMETEPEESAPSAYAGEMETELDTGSTMPSTEEEEPIETGMIPEQILEGETGTIHYSYYLPENYDPQVEYLLMIVMPGYDMMWFGEESSGSNLNWDGFLLDAPTRGNDCCISPADRLA